MSYPPQPPGGYQQAGGYQQQPPQDHPRATMSMILGILGLVICGIIAPFAWRIGKRTMDEIDASGGQLSGRGMAQAGYVMGIIGTVLLALGLLFFLIAIPLGVLSSSGQ
jgi:TRAP-type C4-dicarboxylate transport system permease small subunit